jgi:hypothetical protein
VVRSALTVGVATAALAVLGASAGAIASSQGHSQVADCERGPVMIGSGPANWRHESLAAGPLGVWRHPLAQMSETRSGQLIAKMPVLVEGHREVRLTVPPRERRRVFLYFGRYRDAAGHPTTTIGRAPGFGEVTFAPCADRPRTIWPGGIRVSGRRSVRLLVSVEGRSGAIPLRLGRPRVYRGS